MSTSNILSIIAISVSLIHAFVALRKELQGRIKLDIEHMDFGPDGNSSVMVSNLSNKTVIISSYEIFWEDPIAWENPDGKMRNRMDIENSSDVRADDIVLKSYDSIRLIIDHDFRFNTDSGAYYMSVWIRGRRKVITVKLLPPDE